MITTFDNKEWENDDILSLMDNDEFYYGYLGKQALSSTSFKQILNDFDEFLLAREGLGKVIPKQALRDGRLIHLAVLEPHRLDDLTIIDSTKGSKLYKNAVAERNDAEVYTTREMNKCIPLADNVVKDFDSFMLLDGAVNEVSGIMMLEDLPVRGKADILRKDDNHIIDLKTTSDASRFEQSIDMWGYDLQGALYLKMFNCNRFSFIVLDKITGEVTHRELTKEELTRGQAKLDKAIKIYKDYDCKRGSN